MPRPPALDLSKVRHPRERRVVCLSVLANAGVIALAVAAIYVAPGWLTAHSRVTAVVSRVQAAAVALVLLLPVLSVLRLGRWAAVRENSVRLGRDQVPEIFAILERHCRTLGVEVPELYASRLDQVGISTALALRRGRWAIVLGPELFAGLDRIEDRADVLEWVLGGELGRLLFGHASWKAELLLGYLKRIPVLRLPLLTVQAASRDRLAATLAPGELRGLVLTEVGGDLFAHVDAGAFVRQVLSDDTPPAWSWIGSLGRDGPHVANRIRELYQDGFLDLDRTLTAAGGVPVAGPARTTAPVDPRRSPPTFH